MLVLAGKTVETSVVEPPSLFFHQVIFPNLFDIFILFLSFWKIRATYLYWSHWTILIQSLKSITCHLLKIIDLSKTIIGNISGRVKKSRTRKTLDLPYSDLNIYIFSFNKVLSNCFILSFLSERVIPLATGRTSFGVDILCTF